MRTHIELPRFTICKLLCNAGVVGVLMLGIYANLLQAQTCVTAPSGLVGWWSGEGNALDLLGTNNGTLFGNTTFGAGEAGQAFVFDGSGDAVQLGNPVNLRLQDFTIEAWVKRGSTSKVSLTPGGGTIFGYGDNGYLLGLLDDGHVFLSQVGTSAVISSVQITDLAWHHVAVTKVGTTVVFYVDGVAEPAAAYSANFQFYTSVAIGDRGDNGGNSFLGSIDEVSVYNRALLSSEIQAVFNAGSSGKCAPLPIIVTQPANETVKVGNTASFSVTATSGRSLSYQWQFNAANIDGATNAVLSLINVQSNNAGNYAVIVSNAAGSTNSSNAVLTVNPSFCTSVVSNLVSWWSAEDNALDQYAGNNGTLVGNAAYGGGKVGEAFVFDGSGAGVQIGNPTNLQLQTFTIEAWVKRSSVTQVSLSSSGGTIFGYGASGYLVGLIDDGHIFLSQVNLSGINSSVQITDLTWHHVAVTKTGTTVVFYVDGVAYPAAPYSANFQFNTLAGIGKRIDNGDNSFLGSIDELSVYNRALNASEIQAIYNTDNSGKCPAPPAIVTQPIAQTVFVGNNVAFSAVAYGAPPLGYQWQFNSNNISGATSSALNLTNVQTTNAGNYSVVITNYAGSATSYAAQLAVSNPPVILTNPISQTVIAGATVEFDVAATGDGTLLTYQWQLNTTNISSATNASLIIPAVQATDAGVYRVLVADSSGSAISSNATLTVKFPPNIVAQPTNQTASIGNGTSFSVTATGTPTLIYQWQFNTTNIGGATGPVLNLPNVQGSNAGSYSVSISNAYGSTNSSNVFLTVNSPICNPVVSGLVSLWAGESNAFDQNATNNGTLVGNTAYGAGKVGRAFVLDGSGDAVQIGNPANLQLQTFTIEAWIKRASVSQISHDAGGGTIFGYGTAGYLLGLKDNGQIFLTYVGISESDATIPITDTNWHHLAVTKGGSNVVFYVDGAAVSATVFTPSFQFTTAAAIGARGDNHLNSFLGSIDEVSVYNRALISSEIQGIYNATSAGKCPAPPFIVTQPTNNSVIVGSNATFSVVAYGAPPLSYQWSDGVSNILTGTNATLILTNVQFGQAGTNYSVLVSNSTTLTAISSNVTLTVNPTPSVIQAVSVTATSGLLTVPIDLIAQGNENALGFSLSFNPARLTFISAILGSGAGAAGDPIVNTNLLSAGKVGLALALPANQSFNAGTQEVVDINFFVAPVSSLTVTPITFGGTPITNQVSNPQAVVLGAVFVNGNETIPVLGTEGDVAPRTNGDRSVGITDWVQVGRFVAGLDTTSNASEFMRVDCAPRSTLGNGILTVADWVQAGRYFAQLDPLVAAGGPSQGAGGGGGFVKLLAAGGPKPLTPSARTITAVNTSAQAGQAVQVSVQLNSQGNENALEFSVAFDPAVFTFTGATNGSGASGALLNVNTNHTASGTVGIVLALNPGTTFSAGVREVVKLSFQVASGAGGITNVTFGVNPLPQDVTDAAANDLPASYVNGTVAITPITRPVLTATQINSGLILSWPVSATGFNLESNTNLTSTNWSPVNATLTTNGANVIATNSIAGAGLYYRLHHP